MRGIDRHTLSGHADHRGVLHALEQTGPLAFPIARVFWIQGCPPGTSRANHAVTAHQALVAIAGAVTVDLDNGSERLQMRLVATDDLLVVQAGVWVRLHDFSADAVVMVASSQRFADVRYFDAPQPSLLELLLARAAA
jgi:hypothetical protein